MQAGFAFLEAGSVRSKSTTTILLKNSLDTCASRSTSPTMCTRSLADAFARAGLSGVVYWATGFAFGFGYIGPDSNMFIGYRQFFLSETEGGRLAYFLFEYTFASASATIVRFVEIINSHSFVRSIDRCDVSFSSSSPRIPAPLSVASTHSLTLG